MENFCLLHYCAFTEDTSVEDKCIDIKYGRFYVYDLIFLLLPASYCRYPWDRIRCHFNILVGRIIIAFFRLNEFLLGSEPVLILLYMRHVKFFEEWTIDKLVYD